MRKGKLERLPDLAAELSRLKVDVIVAAVYASGPCCQECHQHDPDCHRSELAIPLGLGSSPAWRGRAGISPG